MKHKERLDKWVTEHYEWLRNEISTNIAKNQMSEYADDLLHHHLSEIYKMNDDKLLQMLDDNKLQWYLLTCAGFSLRSKTSPFYITYRRHKFDTRENYSDGGGDHNNHIGLGILDKIYEPYEDDLYECFQRELDNLHWYQKTLMSRYWLENWNLTKMYKHYNISKIHLIKDLNSAMDIIRDKCKDC